MKKETIFGIPRAEIRRQCEASAIKCDSNSPLRKFETLEPCLEGSRKILEDEELTAMLRRIYTGSDKQ